MLSAPVHPLWPISLVRFAGQVRVPLRYDEIMATEVALIYLRRPRGRWGEDGAQQQQEAENEQKSV
jgi:hypothetical protein